ncbi:hypothetical protein JKF63_01327 [Porcisia hertigi]|uniref:Peroxin 19 n=1 Tax=Porcisia hertigi TaxID=2761500 RepID=A0A836H314_9TRYP|nr:hypothetical protein JKF63_01327 [Porcisia hertigi]
MSDDDLDALLDEAMDIVDEQERKHEDEVRVRDAKLEDDLQKALDETSGTTGADAEMMKMFMSVLGGAGDVGIDDACLGDFKKNVMSLVSTLEGEENLGEEDKANLLRVRELMHVMEEEDVDKANNLLKQMTEEGKLPSSDITGDADVDEASQRFMEVLQNLSSVAQGARPDLAAASSSLPASPAASVDPDASIPAQIDSAAKDMASALVSTISNPEFIEPIKLMRDSYGPYMEVHRSELSSEDYGRYCRQYAKAQEICDFLQDPISGAEDPRLVPLLELMSQFSELGDPPRDLVEYAPGGRKKASSTDSTTA